jgi:nucleotide-binding universal stress UspA family protein
VKKQVGQRKEKSKMPGIIVGVDGSDHSSRALEWAIREASVRHAPLTVLTVQQPAVTTYWGVGAAVPSPYPYDQDLATQALKMAKEETERTLEKAGPESRPPSVTVKVFVGLPAETLLQAAQEADMLVVGSRGAGGFKRLLMGSVSTQVTSHAHCPVVVIPAENS